ncbi:UNVERIFIED_CONTAM: hypothetical protein K2H54_030573 [Gekko kuhli]
MHFNLLVPFLKPLHFPFFCFSLICATALLCGWIFSFPVIYLSSPKSLGPSSHLPLHVLFFTDERTLGFQFNMNRRKSEMKGFSYTRPIRVTGIFSYVAPSDAVTLRSPSPFWCARVTLLTESLGLPL